MAMLPVNDSVYNDTVYRDRLFRLIIVIAPAYLAAWSSLASIGQSIMNNSAFSAVTVDLAEAILVDINKRHAPDISK